MPTRLRPALLAAALCAITAPLGLAGTDTATASIHVTASIPATASAATAPTPATESKGFAGADRPRIPVPAGTARSAPLSIPATVPGKSANPPKPCNAKDMSGCFGYAQTNKIVDYSVQYVVRAARRMYAGLAGPKHFWYVPQNTTYPWCGTTMSDTTFGYCYLDRTVALGQRAVWQFYDGAGDAAPLVGVAHEYAHHIQVMKGVPVPRTAPASVRFENQADCLAGAIVRQLRRERVFTDEDLRDVDDLIPMIASAEGNERDHGTSGERVQAISTGIQYGARTCTRYVPGAPAVG